MLPTTVDDAIEHLGRTVAERIGSPIMSLDELVSSRERIIQNAELTSKDWFNLINMVRTMEILSSFNDSSFQISKSCSGSKNPYSGLTRIFLKKGYLSGELLYDVIDAHMQFTDVRPKGFDAGIIEGNWYDERWAWVASLSINGGSDAITLLNSELGEVGNGLFDENREKENNHWSIAYQEIVLEAMYLARTYSEEDETAKKQAIEKALEYESPHVKKLAEAMLVNPIASTERHSIRDHQILLMYRNARSSQASVNYTAPVYVDKVPLIKGQKPLIAI